MRVSIVSYSPQLPRYLPYLTAVLAALACSDGSIGDGPIEISGAGTTGDFDANGGSDGGTGSPETNAGAGVTSMSTGTSGSSVAGISDSASISTTGASTTTVGSEGSVSTTGSVSASASSTTNSTDSGVTIGGEPAGSGGTDVGGATSTTSLGDATGTTGSTSDADSGTPVGTFADIRSYLMGYCATSTACHGTGAREIVFLGDDLFALLMEHTVPRCNGQPLVVPNEPAGSALYNVLTGGCGNFRMPPGCTRAPCGTDENLGVVESWIQSGAPAD